MNAPQFVTDAAAQWAAQFHTGSAVNVRNVMLDKGRAWMRSVGISKQAQVSDDLAFLAYKCWDGMSTLAHADDLDSDADVASDVLDQYVTDHDAELLVQAIPDVAARMEGEIGTMTPEVSGVYMLLLDLCAAMREQWEVE